MRLPVPRWPLEVDDTVALLGLMAIAAGIWAKYGPAEAALGVGALLLLGYTLREVMALMRPRS